MEKNLFCLRGGSYKADEQNAYRTEQHAEKILIEINENVFG